MQWDVTTAVYLQEFDVSGKEVAPMGLFFKTDGTKMYTVGYDGDTIDEYDLGTQWDVTTAVYLQEFDVSAKELTPRDVFFKPDGTKMYVLGDSGNAVDEYDLGTQWDVTTEVWLQEISIAAKERVPHGLFFKTDGTKMYTLGTEGKTVDEYNLGAQWDVSTAVYLQEISIAAKEISPLGLCFKPDGTKMYVCGIDGITVDEYDLGTQWDVTTAVYLQEISVATKEIGPTGICFKPDGTKMYTVGANGDTVDEYDL